MLTLLILAVATPAPAAVPQYMNYQGFLLDQAGDPLATAEYVLQFEVYDAPSGGNLIWGPQVFDGTQGTGHGELVPVVRGHFNVILGPSDTTSRALSTAFAGQPRYIAVKFRQVADPGLTTISPRQQILSAPYALRAGDADTLAGGKLWWDGQFHFDNPVIMGNATVTGTTTLTGPASATSLSASGSVTAAGTLTGANISITAGSGMHCTYRNSEVGKSGDQVCTASGEACLLTFWSALTQVHYCSQQIGDLSWRHLCCRLGN